MMKNRIIRQCAASALFLAMLLAGCNDAAYSTLENKLFLAETSTSANSAKKILVDESGANVSATARLSNPATTDVRVKLTTDASALEAYNKRNGTNFEPLPAGNYTISETEVTIKKGESLAPAINIALEPLSLEMVETGNQYALAVKIEPAGSSDATVLEGANLMVYSLDQVIVTSVPVLGTDPVGGVYHSAKATLTTPLLALTAWSVEMRVNMSGFRRNNQALFGAWGDDSEIYMRFGDAPTPFNTLQVKFAGSQFDRSVKEFEPNTWYHIAVTYDGAIFKLYIDGEEDTVTDKWPGKVSNIPSEIHIASSGSGWFVDGVMMSEVRFWNVARTKQQIVNNQFTINPQTPGLLMYWKMNEGEGTVLRNSVEGAPDLVLAPDRDLRWVDNVRSDGKGTTNMRD